MVCAWHIDGLVTKLVSKFRMMGLEVSHVFPQAPCVMLW
jgi:hypothetical protein